MDRIIITRCFYGLGHMQVCAEDGVPEDEILEHCNRLNPSGTTNGWVRLEHEGSLGPVACELYPDRTHWLAVC